MFNPFADTGSSFFIYSHEQQETKVESLAAIEAVEWLHKRGDLDGHLQTVLLLKDFSAIMDEIMDEESRAKCEILVDVTVCEA